MEPEIVIALFWVVIGSLIFGWKYKLIPNTAWPKILDASLILGFFILLFVLPNLASWLSNEHPERIKSVLAPIEILATPVALVGIAIFVTQVNAKREYEAKLELSRQQDLNQYLDQITNLIYSKDLTIEPCESSKAKAASARTSEIIQSLDHKRKLRTIRFLTSSELLQQKNHDSESRPALLRSVDLTEQILQHARLIKADLSHTLLGNSDLTYAELMHAEMFKTYLFGSKLIKANLSNAYLHSADLTNVDLSEANLTNAMLVNAKLDGSTLRTAILKGAFYSTEESVPGYPTIFPEDFDPEKAGMKLVNKPEDLPERWRNKVEIDEMWRCINES